MCLEPSKARATPTAQPDGFQSSSEYAPWLSEPRQSQWYFCFPPFSSFLAIYANNILKNTQETILSWQKWDFKNFICYWFRNAFALNTSMNFFFWWQNISSGRSIQRWLAGVPNAASKPLFSPGAKLPFLIGWAKSGEVFGLGLHGTARSQPFPLPDTQ